jgi:hypothetical protein
MPGTQEKNAEAYWNDLMVQVGLTPNSFFSAGVQKEGLEALVNRLRERDQAQAEEVARLKGELKHRNGVLDATQAELGRARGEVDITQAELKQTQGVLDQTIEELGKRKKECSEREGVLQQTRSALDATRAELGTSRALQDAAQSDAADLRTALDAANARFETTRLDLAASKTDLTQARDAEALASRELGLTQAELGKTIKELETVGEPLRAELNAAGTAAAAAKAEADQLRSALAAETASRRALEETLTGLRKDQAHVDAERRAAAGRAERLASELAETRRIEEAQTELQAAQPPKSPGLAGPADQRSDNVVALRAECAEKAAIINALEREVARVRGLLEDARAQAAEQHTLEVTACAERDELRVQYEQQAQESLAVQRALEQKLLEVAAGKWKKSRDSTRDTSPKRALSGFSDSSSDVAREAPADMRPSRAATTTEATSPPVPPEDVAVPAMRQHLPRLAPKDTERRATGSAGAPVVLRTLETLGPEPDARTRAVLGEYSTDEWIRVQNDDRTWHHLPREASPDVTRRARAMRRSPSPVAMVVHRFAPSPSREASPEPRGMLASPIPSRPRLASPARPRLASPLQSPRGSYVPSIASPLGSPRGSHVPPVDASVRAQSPSGAAISPGCLTMSTFRMHHSSIRPLNLL